MAYASFATFTAARVFFLFPATLEGTPGMFAVVVAVVQGRPASARVYLPVVGGPR